MDINKFRFLSGDYYYNDKKLKTSVNSQGYWRVYINKKAYRLHRLIAQKYIANPDKLPVVNHKDGDKNNNHVNNLEWVSYSDNSVHSYKMNKKQSDFLKGAKKVIATEKHTLKQIEFESVRECSRYLKRDIAAVVRCLQGEWKYCNNHALKYAT